MAGRMLQDVDGKLKPGRDWEMEVTDEFSRPLFRLVISAQQPSMAGGRGRSAIEPRFQARIRSSAKRDGRRR
ncbi:MULTISPECIES: DUF6894 family protein [Bradyrhizobium]